MTSSCRMTYVVNVWRCYSIYDVSVITFNGEICRFSPLFLRVFFRLERCRKVFPFIYPEIDPRKIAKIIWLRKHLSRKHGLSKWNKNNGPCDEVGNELWYIMGHKCICNGPLGIVIGPACLEIWEYAWSFLTADCWHRIRIRVNIIL